MPESTPLSFLDYLLPGAGFLANTGVRLLTRPKRRNRDAEITALLAKLGRSIDIGTNESASLAGQQGAEAATARGLTGGEGAQIVSQATAPVFAEAAKEKARAASEAEAWKLGLEEQDTSDLRNWESDFLGGSLNDLLGLGGNILGGISAQKAYQKLISEADKTANGILPEESLAGRSRGLPRLTGNTQTEILPQMDTGQNRRLGLPFDTGQSRISSYPLNRGWDNVTRLGNDRIRFGESGFGTYPDSYGTPYEEQFHRATRRRLPLYGNLGGGRY